MAKKVEMAGKDKSKAVPVKLDTVKVPKKFQPIFEKAQDYVKKYFHERKEDPEKGTIEIYGDRYILVRSASMSVEFFDTVIHLYKDEGKEEALNVARNLLFDIAHAIGKTDAKQFHKKMKVKDPIEKLSAGPVHFSHSGWAFVDIFPESHATPDEDYYLIYDHPYSFESDAWIKAGKKPDFPVCVMNAGYSSGWCEESFGITLVASEITCKAKGDDACRFIMAPPHKIEEHIKRYLKKKPDLAKKVTKYDIPGFFKRKLTEAALQESEELHRITLGSISDAVFITDDRGAFTFICPNVDEIFKYSRDEVKDFGNISKLLGEGFFDTDVLKSHGEITNIDLEIVDKKGDVHSLLVNVKKVDIKGGTILFTCRDISERKRMEEDLRESEEKYRSLVEEAGDGIVIFGMDTKITFINQYLLDLGGYKEKDVVGHDFIEFLPEESLETALDMFEKALDGVETPVAELELKAKDGTIVPVGYKGSLMYDRQGEIIGVRAIIRDITARKHAENVRSVLFNIAHSANESKTLRELLMNIKDELGRLIDTSNFYVALYDKKDDTYSFPYCTDPYEKVDGEIGLKLPDSLTDFVRKKGKPFMADTKKSRELLKKGDVRDRGGVPCEIWLGAPLKTGNEVIGVVAVQDYEDKTKYTKKDLETLAEISEHIAVAVERKRSEEELKGLKDHLEDLVSERTSELEQEIAERTEVEKALRQSEQKTKGIFNAMHDLVFGINRNGVFNFHHSPPEGRLYVPPEVFLGKHYSEVMPPHVSELIKEGMKKNEQYDAFEFEYSLDIEGKPFWFSAKLSPMMLDKEYTGSVAVVRDITQRVVHENELKMAEKEWALTFNSITDTVAVIDTDFRFQKVNKQLADMLGQSPEDLVGKKCYEVIHKAKRPWATCPHQKSLETKEAITEEVDDPVIGKPLLVTTSPILNDDGDIIGSVHITKDISEIRNAQKALVENEERFRRMAGTVHDGLTIIENDKVVFVNDRLCEILGSTEDDLLTLTPYDLIMPGEKGRLQAMYQGMVEDGTMPGEIELWITRPDGSKRYIRNRTSVSREEGEITGQFIITTDITERKIAEDEMKKRVLKFYLEDGTVYLVKEFRPNVSIEAFNDLLNIGYNGLIISRTPKKDLQKTVEQPFEHIWLGEKKGEERPMPSLDFIEEEIKRLRNKTVVLMDRLDYLIFKKGFNETLSLIYNLRDIISLQEQIIIFSLDPSTITESEINLMQKEMSEIEPRKTVKPSEEIYEIVELIYEKNTAGIKPSFSELGGDLNISKPTFRKRVRRLINNGYAVEINKGNKKVLELTQKGRSLFFK